MGSPKADLWFKGRPLLHRVVEALLEVAGQVIVVGAPGQRLSVPQQTASVVFVRDPLPHQGPLAGLYAGLQRAGTGLVLAVACDMPFLSVPLLRAMHPLAVGYDAVLPLVKGRPEPLHAVYRTACAPVIDGLLVRGEHRLGMLAEALEVRYMLPDEWGLYCRDGTSFFNVNTPEDLARAESLA